MNGYLSTEKIRGSKRRCSTSLRAGSRFVSLSSSLENCVCVRACVCECVSVCV